MWHFKRRKQRKEQLNHYMYHLEFEDGRTCNVKLGSHIDAYEYGVLYAQEHGTKLKSINHVYAMKEKTNGRGT